MENTFRKEIETYLVNKKSKTFTLEELEDHILKTFKNMNTFIDKGGSSQLREDILYFENNSIIAPYKSKKDLHLSLRLPNQWRKVKEQQKEEWSRSFVLSKTKLDLTYFINNPDSQTLKNKEYIEILNSFLKTVDSREIVSVEERMYELFKMEKWLKSNSAGDNGQMLLSKVKLTIEDLKAKKFPEPIPYETRKRIPLSQVENVLITENNSFYHTAKRFIEHQREILGIPVDMIVYGRGKQVIANLEYMYTLFEDATTKNYYYIGDIDPEGYSIFINLYKKYPDLNIRIAKDMYLWMLREENNPPQIESDQKKNIGDFEFFLENFNHTEDEFYRGKLKMLWDENKRIPQEIVNYEKLLGKKGNYD